VTGIAHEVEDTRPHHLREYLRVLYKRRRLVAACFGATFGLAILVTLFLPRRYTAWTRLEVERRSPIQLRLQDTVLRLDDDHDAAATFVATQVAALQSRDLAERVIRSRRLGSNAAFLNPGRAQAGQLSTAGTVEEFLRPRGWDASTAAGDHDGAAGGPDGDHGAVSAELINRYMRYLAVRDVPGTDLVEVRFTTPSPSLSAFLTAAHTRAYMDANDAARRATDAVAKDFLTQQLNGSRERVARAETALARFAAGHPGVAVDQEHNVGAQRLTELSGRLTRAEGDRVALESRYAFLTRKGSSPLAFFLDRPAIQKLRLSLLEAREQMAALEPRLGPNHPQMVELVRLRAELARQLDAELQQEIAGVQARHDAARMRADRLRRRIDKVERAGLKLRGLGSRYDLLKGDLETARNLHASLLKQATETAVNSELVPATVRVVERAEVPERPSRPNVPLNLLFGVTAGLVVAGGAAFASEYFDDTVRSSQEVENLLHAPALGAIPSFVDGSGDLVVLREPSSPVAEAFRSMRTAVLFSPTGAPRVVLVTSARPAEGKTVASLNLAATLAGSGSRVLLIDADLRHPRCHAGLGVPNDEGLSTVLGGRARLEDVIRSLDRPRISFLPAGPPPPNPGDLIHSTRMREIVADVRARFEFVVLDTPPVLPVADALVLAREADGVLLVVKGHDTSRELVRLARDRLALAGARLLGVVVNDVRPDWGDLYYYYPYSSAGYAQPHAVEERA